MNLSAIDWAIVFGYFALSMAIGILFTKKGGESVEEYFLSGRNVSWWLAGASMVATTFAADTPLVVTGLVFAQRRRGQLDLVEHADERNAHRVLLRAALAPRRRDDGRRVRGAALQRKARRGAARLPRALPRAADQPDHPRLGDEGDDQDPHDLARPAPGERPRHVQSRARSSPSGSASSSRSPTRPARGCGRCCGRISCSS